MLLSLSCEMASPIAGVTPPFGPNSPTTSLRLSINCTMRAGVMSAADIDADVVGAGVDLEILRTVGRLESLDRRLEGRLHAVVDLDIADQHGVREQNRTALDIVLD